MLPLLGINALGIGVTNIAQYVTDYNRGKILNEDFRDWLRVNARTMKQAELAAQPITAIGGQFDWRRSLGNKDYLEQRAELDAQLANLPADTEEDLFSPEMKRLVNDTYGEYYRNAVKGLSRGYEITNSILEFGEGGNAELRSFEMQKWQTKRQGSLSDWALYQQEQQRRGG